jgi:hypothetical protein
LPSFPLTVANVAASNNGVNTLVTNPYKTVAQAQTHGQQRGAVIRVFSYNIQNQSGSTANVSFTDSSGTNIAGPFMIPASTGNWTERASFPSFLFETTRSSSNGIGYDLTLTTNSAGPFQCEVEWTLSFVPGRPGN